MFPSKQKPRPVYQLPAESSTLEYSGRTEVAQRSAWIPPACRRTLFGSVQKSDDATQSLVFLHCRPLVLQYSPQERQGRYRLSLAVILSLPFKGQSKCSVILLTPARCKFGDRRRAKSLDLLSHTPHLPQTLLAVSSELDRLKGHIISTGRLPICSSQETTWHRPSDELFK